MTGAASGLSRALTRRRVDYGGAGCVGACDSRALIQVTGFWILADREVTLLSRLVVSTGDSPKLRIQVLSLTSVSPTQQLRILNFQSTGSDTMKTELKHSNVKNISFVLPLSVQAYVYIHILRDTTLIGMVRTLVVEELISLICQRL